MTCMNEPSPCLASWCAVLCAGDLPSLLYCAAVESSQAEARPSTQPGDNDDDDEAMDMSQQYPSASAQLAPSAGDAAAAGYPGTGSGAARRSDNANRYRAGCPAAVGCGEGLLQQVFV